MTAAKYAVFAALDPFFDIVQQGLAGLVDGHGKTVATGSAHDNRFISVVTIEGRKIMHWRDYMDSLAAMTALNQVQ